MKTNPKSDLDAIRRARQRGTAVVVLLAMLAIMMILVAANGRTIFHLQRELRLIERQQVQRLNAAQTNAVIVVPPAGTLMPSAP